MVAIPCGFESHHRHHKKEGCSFASFFFVMWWDSNPFQCKMPVAFCGNQFKNWLQLYFLRSKKAIESHHRHCAFTASPVSGLQIRLKPDGNYRILPLFMPCSIMA